MFSHNELILNRSDIDFSPNTTQKIKKSILKHLEEISIALCETPQSLKRALLDNKVTLGRYTQSHGMQMIYIHLNQHDYVIPCVTEH